MGYTYSRHRMVKIVYIMRLQSISCALVGRLCDHRHVLIGLPCIFADDVVDDDDITAWCRRLYSTFIMYSCTRSIWLSHYIETIVILRIVIPQIGHQMLVAASLIPHNSLLQGMRRPACSHPVRSLKPAKKCIIIAPIVSTSGFRVVIRFCGAISYKQKKSAEIPSSVEAASSGS